MRVLHTADWHFGRTLEGRSRMEEQEAFVDELVQIVNEEAIDVILLAGDVYDTVNPPAAAEQLFYEAMERLSDQGRRSIVIISGNHDHPDRLAAASSLLRRQGITLIGQPSEEAVRIQLARTNEEAIIAALPYPSEARLKQLLTQNNEEEAIRSAYSDKVAQLFAKQTAAFRADTVNLMMSHLYVLGGKETESERPIQVGGAYTVHPDAFYPVLGQQLLHAQYVALGHLHRPQMVKGKGVIRYSGSPIAYSFSEAGQTKSVTVFDAAPGSLIAPEEKYLTSGKVLSTWQAKGGYAELCNWLDEGRDAAAWLDVSVHLTEALTMEQIQHIRRAHAGIVHIRPIYPEMEAIAEEEGQRAAMPVHELFRRFYERQTGGASPDDALVDLFLELIGEEEPVEEEAAG
ncbi:exonuclease SbcCD subunit D [Paenibacillus agilis]|uniref:Nuclease SbcCD subunit D n=1 Tax=Paenibacillus agilis TaxID=3020863 RepID=A0A559J3A8_9BACL|nr:exonuclease SbcCD subunit D [Paenibacillus agilis]TVX94306.1 exonuclease SbcCD subunit D [Paenibacillus agilis]